MGENNEDQRWLDGLAGRSEDGASDSAVQIEARLIREAVVRQSQSQEKGFKTTEAGFQKLVDAATQQGMLRREPGIWGPMRALRWMFELSAWRYSTWTVAATLVVGIALTVQFQLISPNSTDDPLVLRGASQSQVLFAEDPEIFLAQLTEELKLLPVHYAVARPGGEIILRIDQIDLKNNATIDVLQKYLIRLPTGTQLNVEIRKLTTK